MADADEPDEQTQQEIDELSQDIQQLQEDVDRVREDSGDSSP